MKKIYFGCSIAGGRDHADFYSGIVKLIKGSGAEVMSEMFADKELKAEVGTNLDPTFVWKRDTKWINEADALIMEVTQPSLGVGYEIGKAEEFNKPVFALFYAPSDRRLSPMISGNPNVKVIEYKQIRELEKPILEFIESL